MIKQIIYLIVVSIIAFLLLGQIQIGLHYLANWHQMLYQNLSHIFAGGWLGMLIRQSISLFAIPFVLGIIPGTVYWFAKRQQMPYLYHVIWVVWLVLLTTIAIIR